jgi:hypothetical protein
MLAALYLRLMPDLCPSGLNITTESEIPQHHLATARSGPIEAADRIIEARLLRCGTFDNMLGLNSNRL